MKKLNAFQKFDFNAWHTGKKFMVTGVKYNEKKGCVTLDVVITEDKTDYQKIAISMVLSKEGSSNSSSPAEKTEEVRSGQLNRC